jgi:hypothetical protein
MIVRVFSLFDQTGPFVERAAKSLRILADKAGERLLAKDHYCVVKVSFLSVQLMSRSRLNLSHEQPLYKQKLYNTLLPALINSGA